ncbi:MAG: hypothetical protein HOG79_14660 [Prolixibacteraceae bacterium]|jgi:aminopeptidase|nr:hypothetical protein [Prolixibacteraceae bacterium]
MQYLNAAETSAVESAIPTFNKILKQCFKVKKEKLLIVSDLGEEGKRLALMLAYGHYLAAKKRKIEVELVIQNVKKGFMEAEPHVVRAIESLPSGSVILVNVSNKFGRFGGKKSFRKFCKDSGHRFGSASGLSGAQSSHFPIFIEAMNINYLRMQKTGLKIKKQMDKAKEIKITTELGTNLVANIEGMQAVANVGAYSNAGDGGNVPAGEVYIAPKGIDNVNGIVVLDGSIRHESGTKLLNNKLIMHIENGKVIKLEGPQAHILESTFRKFEDRAKFPERIRLVAEIGVGINPGAVLMGIALMDEKAQGTAHIGIGSNSWFGGDIKTIFHGDMTFKNPKILLDGKELIL